MNMLRLCTAVLTCALLLPGLAGCKKDKDGTGTQAPDTTGDGDGETGASTEDPEAPPTFDVPQEPDPAEIVAARELYLKGDYPAVLELLTPIRDDLEARSQYRASGLAAGWLALAHARDVVENAEPHAKYAKEMAEKTRDPEVITVAGLAEGVVFLGFEDYSSAVSVLEAAAATKAPPTELALAHGFLGQAFIGRAYGAGGGAKLQNPEDLDRARDTYQAGLALAPSSPVADALLGKLHEGLAAIGKYQGKYDQLCEHALAAREKYTAAGASDYLLEGPGILIRDGRCDQK